METAVGAREALLPLSQMARTECDSDSDGFDMPAFGEDLDEGFTPPPRNTQRAEECPWSMEELGTHCDTAVSSADPQKETLSDNSKGTEPGTTPGTTLEQDTPPPAQQPPTPVTKKRRLRQKQKDPNSNEAAVARENEPAVLVQGAAPGYESHRSCAQESTKSGTRTRNVRTSPRPSE